MSQAYCSAYRFRLAAGSGAAGGAAAAAAGKPVTGRGTLFALLTISAHGRQTLCAPSICSWAAGGAGGAAAGKSGGQAGKQQLLEELLAALLACCDNAMRTGKGLQLKQR